VLASRPGFEKRISHMRCHPALLTGHVILSRPILGISNDDLRLATRIALVLIEQLTNLNNAFCLSLQLSIRFIKESLILLRPAESRT